MTFFYSFLAGVAGFFLALSFFVAGFRFGCVQSQCEFGTDNMRSFTLETPAMRSIVEPVVPEGGCNE